MRLIETSIGCLLLVFLTLILVEGNYAIENGSDQLTSSEILQASVKVADFMEKNQRLPNYVTVKNESLDIPSYTYALSKALAGSQIMSMAHVDGPSLNIKRSSQTLNSKQYTEVAVRLRDYTSRYQRCPSTVNYTGGTLDFYNTVYLLSKAGRYTYRNGKKPATVYIKTPVPANAYKLNSYAVDERIRTITARMIKTKSLMAAVKKRMSKTTNKSLLLKLQSRYRGLNSTYNSLSAQIRYYRALKSSQWYVPESLRPYTKGTAYCNINDPNIVYLARDLSANTSYDTANNIFTWVRDSVDYSFYYRSRYGASGTLRYREGNCVDQAHLVVALARTSGIPARYVRGYCKFISGNWYSHVWAQVWIKGRGWITADTTHSMNSLGSVKNWNTTASKINGVLREYSL